MKGILLAVMALPFVGCCAHMCGGERLRDSVADIRPAGRTAPSASFPTPKVVSAARPVSASRAIRTAAVKPIQLGVYFATTGGEVWGSTDEGERWQNLVGHLPQVYTLEVTEAGS